MKFVETMYGLWLNSINIKIIYVNKEENFFFLKIELNDGSDYTHSRYGSNANAHSALLKLVRELGN